MYSNTQNSIKRRNSSIELLRFFFMFCIVLIHIYGFGVESYPDQIFELGRSLNTCHHLSLNCIGQIGVTGFMFISGYYGIKTNKYKIIDLIIMTTFYAVIIELLFNSHIRLENIRKLLHAFDLIWFISYYIVICLIAPIIETGIKQISPKTFRNIVIGILSYIYGAHLIGFSNDHDFVFLFTVYITARYIRMYKPSFLYKHTSKIACTSVILIGGIPVLFSMAGTSHYPIMNIISTNNNILLLALAASLVIILDNKYFYIPAINNMASSVLAICLITSNEHICHPLSIYLYPTLLKTYGFGIVIVICLLCIFVDKIRVILFDSIYKTLHFIKK